MGKADGYNHGDEHVARAALGAGASELGVTTVDEAVALRTAGIGAPILSWLHGVDTDFAPAIANGFSLSSLFSTHPPLERRLEQLGTISAQLGRPGA